MFICVLISAGMLYQAPAGSAAGVTAQKNVIAEIGDDKLTEEMVIRRIRETFGNQTLPSSMLAVYVPVLIQRMIFDRAAAYEAAQMGFTVSDAEVRRQMRSIPQFANLSPDEVKKVVEQMGYTIEEFERDFRKNAVEKMLLDQVADGVTVTNEDAENAYRETNLKIRLRYIVFPGNKDRDAMVAADMLTKNGGDIEALAQRFGLEVKTSDPFTRNGSIGGMEASRFGEAFSKAVGAPVGPIIAGGPPVVAKVVEKIDADMKGFAAQRDAIKTKIMDRKLEERRQSLEDSLLAKLAGEGKLKVHKDVVDRMLSKYQEN
jgi:hypothetical protein